MTSGRDAPIEAASVQPLAGEEGQGNSLEQGNDPADAAEGEPRSGRKKRRFPINFVFLDPVLGPDPED